jgi:DNA polymerase III subunit alpha
LEARYGAGLLLGLEPARESSDQRLGEAAEPGLRSRWIAERSGGVRVVALERLRGELSTIQAIGCAELLLAVQDVAAFPRAQRIALGARGSATSSLVAWALGSTELCPHDYQIDARRFAYDGRPDLLDPT